MFHDVRCRELKRFSVGLFISLLLGSPAANSAENTELGFRGSRLLREYSDGCSGLRLNEFFLLSPGDSWNGLEEFDNVVSKSQLLSRADYRSISAIPLPKIEGIRGGPVKRAGRSASGSTIVLTSGDVKYFADLQSDSAIVIKDAAGNVLINRKKTNIGRFQMPYHDYDLGWAGDLNDDGKLDVIAFWYTDEDVGYDVWISRPRAPHIMCSIYGRPGAH